MRDWRERRDTIRSGLKAGKSQPRNVAPSRGQAGVAALTVGTLQAVQPTWQPGLSLRAVERGHVVAGKSGKVLHGIEVPTLGLDPDMVASIGRGAGRLSSVAGFRVLHWEVSEAIRQWVEGVRDYHRLVIEGGYRGLAALAGVPTAADEVRDVVRAQAHLRYPFAEGTRGNLLHYREPTQAARNRPSVLVLALGDPLLPGFASQLPASALGLRHRRNRWLVPMLTELPRLDALPRQAQAAGIRLHWLFLRQLAGSATELESRGGIALADTDWVRLAHEAHLRPEYLTSLLSSWQEPWVGPPFLAQPEPDVWCLASEHAAATQFVLDRLELGRQWRRTRGASPR